MEDFQANQIPKNTSQTDYIYSYLVISSKVAPSSSNGSIFGGCSVEAIATACEHTESLSMWAQSHASYPDKALKLFQRFAELGLAAGKCDDAAIHSAAQDLQFAFMENANDFS